MTNVADKIIVALDVATKEKALELVEQLPSEISFFKIGLQLYAAEGPEIVRAVLATGAKVWLDLKLYDIPNTVARAVESASALGVQMLTIHLSGGSEMIRAATAARANDMLLLGVTVLTSATEQTLREIGITDTVEDQVIRLAKLGAQAGIDGVVASPREIKPLRREFGDRIKIAVQGIRPSWAEPGDQKRFMTPREAIQAGADYIGIGRPITGHQTREKLSQKSWTSSTRDCHVERSRDISGDFRLQKNSRFLDSARNDKAQQATRPLFAGVTVYHDESPHSAAINMAIDEALLETAVVPTIRFYRWRVPALSFGYFGKFSDVAIYAAERDLVRRWTGGGIVFHGDDLTYSIVIPARDPLFDESSVAIYEKIHRALCGALVKTGQRAVVAGGAGPGGLVVGTRAAVSASGYNCFANPVRADVMMDGRKIAGAAQRRTRRGLLQQGSIQGITMKTDLAQKFAQALSANCSEFEVNEEIYRRGQELAQQKYGTESWLRKR